jgi:hypothetical protein
MGIPVNNIPQPEQADSCYVKGAHAKPIHQDELKYNGN